IIAPALPEPSVQAAAARHEAPPSLQPRLGVPPHLSRHRAARCVERAGGGHRAYRLAAKDGYADAQVNLGAIYSDGRGVKQDFEEAVRMYRLAAAQNRP